MDKKRRMQRQVVIAIMLAVSIGNYTRIIGTENIRAVAFLSIFAIGALSGILLVDIIKSLREKKEKDS